MVACVPLVISRVSTVERLEQSKRNSISLRAHVLFSMCHTGFKDASDLTQ